MRPVQHRVCGAYKTTLFACSSEHQADESTFCTSRVLGELWFARIPTARSVLECKKLPSKAPQLYALSNAAFPELLSGSFSHVIERSILLSELKSIQAQLHQGTWPKRFFFAPDLPLSSPLPSYSSRILRTGVMHAGFDLCMINRNWDGTDRIEDLTSREHFDDAVGVVQIIRRSIAEHLSSDLEVWIGFVEALQVSAFEIRFERFETDPEKLLLKVQERAERWRQRWDIPDYQSFRIQRVEEQWKAILKRKRPHYENVIDLGAYMSEMMRALWGGYYRPLQEGDGIPTFGESIGISAQAEPAVVLEFPFDCSIQPLEKVHRSLEQKKSVNWPLQIQVLSAQKRQRQLLVQLGHELYHPDFARQRAAFQILFEIPDARVDRMFVNWLSSCEDHDCTMYVLERLFQSRMRLDTELLIQLARHERIGISARAVWLLKRKKFKALPQLLRELLAGGLRIPLRPLGRHILEHWEGNKAQRAEARKILKGLGPIPPAKSDEHFYPDPPTKIEMMPLLAEILEDSANPVRRETALRILMLFPNREETEALGLALADPEPQLRMATIGLLAGTDRYELLQLLKTRRLFENHPICSLLLQQSIQS